MKEERCEVQVGLYAIWQCPSVYLLVFLFVCFLKRVHKNAVFLKNLAA